MNVTAAKERPIIFGAESVRSILAGAKTQTRRVVKPQLRYDGRGFLWDFKQSCAVGFDHANEYCPYGVVGGRLWVRETCLPCRETGDVHPVDLGVAKYVCFRDGSQQFKGGGYHQWNGPMPKPDTWPRGSRFHSPIHMPRWASRLTIEIVSVRVDRLQAITEEDAAAEGIEFYEGPKPEVGCFWVGRGYWDGFSRHSVTGEKTYHARGSTLDRYCSCHVGKAEKLTPAGCAFRHAWDRINRKKHPWASNPWVWVIEFKRITRAP